MRNQRRVAAPPFAIEAHPIADAAPDRLAALAGDELGGGARRDAARLEHDDLQIAGDSRIEQGGGYARRLAGARVGAHDNASRGGEPGADVGQQGIDRQGAAIVGHRLARPVVR